jgi:hypothetical protein
MEPTGPILSAVVPSDYGRTAVCVCQTPGGQGCVNQPSDLARTVLAEVMDVFNFAATAALPSAMRSWKLGDETWARIWGHSDLASQNQNHAIAEAIPINIVADRIE